MKFRKKPVVIDAMQFTGKNHADALAFCERNATAMQNDIAISTLEGLMRANPGDWIVKGVEGEFYPVKPSVFAATYESVDETTGSAR